LNYETNFEGLNLKESLQFIPIAFIF
jgi:hypothetical protein